MLALMRLTRTLAHQKRKESVMNLQAQRKLDKQKYKKCRNLTHDFTCKMQLNVV